MLIHLQSPRSPATTNPSDPERRVPLKKTQTEGYTSNTRKTRDLPPASSCSLAAEPRTLLYPPVRARLEALIFPEISQDNRVICHRTTSIYNTTADRGTQRVQVCWSQMAQPIKMASTIKETRLEAERSKLLASFLFPRIEVLVTCWRMPRKEQRKLEYGSLSTQGWQLQNMIQCRDLQS